MRCLLPPTLSSTDSHRRACVTEDATRFSTRLGSYMSRICDLRAPDSFAPKTDGPASQVMRSVILNSVRERLALKRGSDRESSAVSTPPASNPCDEQRVLDVHEALKDLEKADPRLAKVAEMRYFGGYSEKEIAATLQITERTVQLDWEKARLILAAALR
jgi:DNA-directed RNA polymerase specialized sigma24 family protein